MNAVGVLRKRSISSHEKNLDAEMPGNYVWIWITGFDEK